jgi:hypothetical protein
VGFGILLSFKNSIKVPISYNDLNDMQQAEVIACVHGYLVETAMFKRFAFQMEDVFYACRNNNPLCQLHTRGFFAPQSWDTLLDTVFKARQARVYPTLYPALPLPRG